MSSTILYKFRSGTTFEALPLPGTAARLFDVKKGIVKAKRLDVGGMDFELEVHDATTNQQYIDESMLLPRGTRLIVRRVGAARGQGFVNRMQRAEAGGGMGVGAARTAAPTGFYTIESNHHDDDEFVSTNQRADENELAALMAATETAQNPVGGMRPAGAATGGYRPAGSGPPPQQSRPGGNFSKPQNFRPNADPELRAHEQREAPKPKKATGIPRTFLNLSAPPVVDGLAEGGADSGPRLQPNALGFEELVNRGGGQSGNNTGSRRDLDYALKLTATTIPEHLQCGICNGVVKNAMLLPWDLEGRTTCETCIRDALAQSGFRCPLTGNEGVSPDDLFPNMALRKAADLFVRGVMEKMEEIVQQQVEEPDQEETALTSKEFEGETGEKGVIVSKKTMKEHRSKRHDDDDPFGGGDDDFGGDVFAVEAEETEEPDVEDPKETSEPTEKTSQAQTGGANASETAEKTPAEKVDDKSDKRAQPPNAVAPDPAVEEEKRREARKQRALPTGYVMGPAGGATGPPTPTETDRQDGGFRGRGRGGGRGWDRGGGGGYRDSRGGRGGRGGRSFGRGSRDYDGGGRGGYQARDQGYAAEERGSNHEVSLRRVVNLCRIAPTRSTRMLRYSRTSM